MGVARGDVRLPAAYTQLRDYSGLRYGNITPTDIDGLIEYKGRAYVILEVKYMDAIMAHGQELALERLTDDLEKAGKPTLCVIAAHNAVFEAKIKVAEANVQKYRFQGKWHESKNLLAGEMITRFLAKFD